jgi:hypothetical protein
MRAVVEVGQPLTESSTVDAAAEALDAGILSTTPVPAS